MEPQNVHHLEIVVGGAAEVRVGVLKSKACSCHAEEGGSRPTA